MSINFSNLSKGTVIEFEDAPWQIMDYERHKMQQRAPVTRLKMKNLLILNDIWGEYEEYEKIIKEYLPTVIK